ncbi:UDP-phosphate glucose phosphotransferase [Lysinibacillus sp. KCTC 33748]|uniref:sugar transferase n=1 Tax=unclassified Lysinibacillus TaxID=2636778 RepID=UPI0009A5B647|nr:MULTISPECIES: sugar transferase [unclassified Lysinibacillus]OXS74057.1 UDP-phosphate glucose phosphotransferase [Lysinibacillus sp. KCTC 33748]SKB69944.1 Sugar transferase involved in LPS biosynthesis (colanic, teichoic acid) [Lysinibacillus sp. AC-3]
MHGQLAQTKTFYSKIGKRIFDIVGALLLLFITIPLMLVVFLILLISTGRPVFFKQIRTGQEHQRFIIWKLRTMTIQAVPVKMPRLCADGIPDDFYFKTEQDARITRVGAVLRKLSIDEIPQLINVLKGDMSIVGPRPEVPTFTNAYNTLQARRLEVKPGLTGLAQINGRSNISHGQKISYDLEYVVKYSFWMDIKIIIKTLFVVLARTGAY